MFKLIRRLITAIIIIIILFVGYIVYEGYTMYQSAISEISLSSKISQLKSSENYVTIDKIPQKYKDAVVSTEDHRFFDHSGVDYVSVIRAVVINFEKKELDQGGSTITQQLAKNLYFSQQKKFTRKIAELFVAIDLEKNYSKDEILELYMNTIYFGKRILRN